MSYPQVTTYDKVGRVWPELLVRPGDVEALAARVNHVIEHPEHYRENCEAGRRWVSDTFGPDSVLPRLLSIYERIRPANPSQLRPDA